MSALASLSPGELAAQLSHPEGASGLAVADALEPVNRAGNAAVVAALTLRAGDRVLEVGCGLATMAPAIVATADAIDYFGVDRSETMIAAASDRHAGLVRAGRASFHLARIEAMPFAVGRFTKIFSVGVIHFWADPVTALREIRRVAAPGAVLAMGALGPERAPPFALADHGFHLRDAAAWREIGVEAGLSGVAVRALGEPNGPQAILFTACA